MASMFEKSANLINYWHLLVISSELKRKKSLRMFIYEIPILIWRDANDDIHAVLDACSHKRSILKVTDFTENEITCPYHGWKYDKKGALVEIPCSPDLDLSKMKCQLDTFHTKEVHGLIWIYLNNNQPPKNLPFSLEHEVDKKWSQVFLRRTFETTEDLLIENFMDATHTAFTHKGIIRGHGDKVQHLVKVITNEDGLIVSYAETTEKIGIALELILGKDLRVRHTDQFLFPNLVKVTYVINDTIRFTAVISCTSSFSGKTEAVIRLSFNFNWLNPIIKIILPFLTRKVLDQDFEITKQQYENQQIFKELKDHSIPTDMIYNKVKSLRKSKTESKESVKNSEKTFSLYL